MARSLFVTARQLVALQLSDVLDGAFALNTWEMTLTGQNRLAAPGSDGWFEIVGVASYLRPWAS
jgi:hypothetical protein